jgi:hypothetical protein
MKKAALLLIASCICSVFCFADQQADFKASLKGLSSVGINIVELPKDAIRFGLRADELSSMIKGMLEKTEIKVLKDLDRSTVPGKPYLNLSIFLMASDKTNSCALMFELSLWQDAKLVRDEKVESFSVMTWNNRALTLIQPGLSLEAVHSKLVDSMNEFIKAWCEANNKPLPKDQKKSTV